MKNSPRNSLTSLQIATVLNPAATFGLNPAATLQADETMAKLQEEIRGMTSTFDVMSVNPQPSTFNPKH